jgi:hypothetical protein
VLTCADSSGSGTAQSCTTSPSFTPAANDCIVYTTTTSNTGALTINVNSVGAKSAVKWQGTALAAGDVPANKPVLACYDGTNWNLSTIGNVPSGGGGSETTNSQSNLAVTSTGDQLVTILTPGSNGLYRVSVTAACTTVQAGCSTNVLYSVKIAWTSAFASVAMGVTNGTLGCVNSNEQTISATVYAKSGVAILGGINVGTAAAGCSTFPLVSTQMEALP